MNLIIDQGNSVIKSAIFSEGRLLHKYSCTPTDFRSELFTTKRQFPEIKACLLASVGDFPKEYLAELKHSFDFIQLESQTPVPFENNYLTPHTLGVDRLGLAAAAVKTYPGEPVLVIDSGTCITYDLVTAESVYMGGVISPGLRMRYTAMSSFTSRLPELQPVSHTPLVGNSTATSMHSGVLRAVCFEMEGYIDALKADHSGLVVVLTGGDAHFLRDNLKSDIFAHSNFLLEGLNHILEHNKGKC